jgi:hypothetical protein
MPDSSNLERRGSPGAGWSIAAALVCAVGAWLRLARLDLVEFKADERNALDLGLALLSNPPWRAGGRLPAHGMPSSHDLPNAPLFNWIMAGAWAATGHPLGATALVAAVNAIALYPLWRWASRRLDPERALLLLATAAVSPFFVLLSRKLWGQDLLFPALVGLLWAVEYWHENRVFRAAALFLLACLPIGQLHQSGPIALAMFPVAVALASLGDRPAFRARIRRLGSLSGAQYVALALLVLLQLFFWLPYARYLLTVPIDVFANRPRLKTFEPILLVRVVKQVAPLDLFFFFGPDRLDFLSSAGRNLCYRLASFTALPLAAVGTWGWARHPNRLPILGIWWWLIIVVFTLAHIPTPPFYALVLSPLPAALLAGAFDGRFPRAWVERLFLTLRWTCVLTLMLLSIVTGRWLSDRGGSRGDYGVVYGVRSQQAAALFGGTAPPARPEGLVCHEPPGEVAWIAARVYRLPTPVNPGLLCDGWTADADRPSLSYRWSVKR